MRPDILHKMIGGALLSGLLLTPTIAFGDDPLETCTDSSGTYTYKQFLGKNDEVRNVAPQYHGTGYLEQTSAPFFWTYSAFDHDGGWMHDFPFLSESGDVTVGGCTVTAAQKANLLFKSVTLNVKAYDVDSEPEHGTGGEYDGLFLDGKKMNPGLLQGFNGQWNITSFDIPVSAITGTDNGYEPDPGTTPWDHTLVEGSTTKYNDGTGKLYFYLDIDMNHSSRHWLTQVKYSELVVEFETPVAKNEPPYITDMSISPGCLAYDDDALTVSVTAADDDGTIADTSYRWFVDVGQGFFVDAVFAGRTLPDPQTATLPSSATQPGDKWKVEVTVTDSGGAVSEKKQLGDFASAGCPHVEIGYNNAYPSPTTYNTLLFEDMWPLQGDYDMNDMVIQYRVETDTDANGNLKKIVFHADAVARGAGFYNGFGFFFPTIDKDDVLDTTLFIYDEFENEYQAVSPSQVPQPQGDNNDKLYFILVDPIIAATGYMPCAPNVPAGNCSDSNFYNTEPGDHREAYPFVFTVEFKSGTTNKVTTLDTQLFNPFLWVNSTGLGLNSEPDYEAFRSERKEVHLVNHQPTGLATAYFGQGDDASDSSSGKYYRTARNFPWVLNVPGRIAHPCEGIDIIKAYPAMEKWIESGGASNADWYKFPDSTKVWPCTGN